LLEYHLQTQHRHIAASLEGVIAVHQYFRFDHGYETCLLAQRGIARKRVRIGFDATPAGPMIIDGNDGAPLRKASAHQQVLLETISQSIQTLGYFLSRVPGQLLSAHIHFDTRNDPGMPQGLEKRSAVFLILADRLVVEDYAADILAEADRGDDQISISAPRSRRFGDAELCEPLVACGGAFINRQQSSAGTDQGSRNVDQRLAIH